MKQFFLLVGTFLFFLGIPFSNYARTVPVGKSKLFHYNKSIYDPLWVTLSDSTEVKGPLLPHYQGDRSNEDFQEDSENYVRTVFGLTVQAAHNYALEIIENESFQDRRNFNGYWAFLLASLVVPYHESRLSHIRTQKSDRCVDKANQFSEANNRKAKVSPTIRSILSQFYRNPANPLVADCKQLKKQTEIRQFIFNGTALGMWQTNARYHIDAVSPEVVLNLKETINYGVGYLYSGDQQLYSQGFFGILKSYQKYSSHCHFRSEVPVHRDTKDFEMNNIYFNLIRGAYGGQFYYGQTIVPAVCSFSRTYRQKYEKDHKGEDGFHFNKDWIDAHNKFYQSLRDVLVGYLPRKSRSNSYPMNQNSIYQELLPAQSLEKEVFDIIIHQFQKIHQGKEGGLGDDPQQIEVLQKLLQTSYQDEALERKNNFYASHFTLNKRTKVYVAPQENDEHLLCGYLQSSNENGVPVTVLDQFQEAKGVSGSTERWAQVRIPKQSEFLDLSNIRQFLTLKNYKNSANIRLAPTTKVINGVDTNSGLELNRESGGINRLKYLGQKAGHWYLVAMPDEFIASNDQLPFIERVEFNGKSYTKAWVHEINVNLKIEDIEIKNPICLQMESFYIKADNLAPIPQEFLSKYLFKGRIDTQRAPLSMKNWLRVRPSSTYSSAAIGVVENLREVYVIGESPRSYKIWFPDNSLACFFGLDSGVIRSGCFGWVDKNFVTKIKEDDL